ncbi:hypothetical protein [Desulfovibrio litoralis]|uniref:Helix-turn-helix domain-containing protein n=1 Tax=Desulfovibrio litoralis DSM 11393 TaxID=1121455 RepID=A0A1M7S5X6_9BACT|nr:hypothetical protein [Desulfovibrio litoralis]SHN53876.1 hypothetical protein SAMN02745728_00465 [Desulfovibrio litoralis DSM 11393]
MNNHLFQQLGLKQNREHTQTRLVLVGLSNIAKAVGAGEGTIRRWIKNEGFPAKRYSDGIYRAEPETIRHWFQQYVDKENNIQN